MRGHRGRWKIGIEEHIATPRDIKLSTQRELFDQRCNPIEFSFMAQLLEVDVVKGKCVVAQVGEDVTEQIRVPVNQCYGGHSCSTTGDHTYQIKCFTDKVKSDNNLSMNIAPCSSLLV